MRYLFILLLCLVAPLSAFSSQVEKDPEALPEEVDFSEPPFWMFTYDEFSDLQGFQKRYYVKNAGPAIRKIEGLESVSQEKWQEASEWYKTWDHIARRVYIACRSPKLEKSCKALASVRKEALKLK